MEEIGKGKETIKVLSTEVTENSGNNLEIFPNLTFTRIESFSMADKSPLDLPPES